MRVTFYVPGAPACVCACDERDRDAELQRRGEHVMWEQINKRIISFSLHFAHSLFTAADIASFPTSPGKQWGKSTACLSLLHPLQFHNILWSSRFNIQCSSYSLLTLFFTFRLFTPLLWWHGFNLDQFRYFGKPFIALWKKKE